ncbi:DMT family transporter [Altererythrobacter arenosus]|uniref:DMT family transporter n=1 Tax=Altererythrobacter arenosus TaxID=3032592 RepID=A0ABY8FMI3_9SPHN|nr:DMT family transporter [Altererythrobacter sp. CAU 1644]WFL76067.1 DMT family transporter [Altererythrobacter sp. CAU 1644]
MSRNHLLMPIAAAMLGVACLSLMDAYMKGAALAAGAYSASILRSGIATAIILPVWLGSGAKWPERRVMKLHILRGTVSGFMALSFFYALTELPIAEAIAISFIAPLMALYLAAILLGETIRREAITGSVLGLIGTLIIVGGRIGAADYDSGTLKGLAAITFSALLYAFNFIVIRWQAQAAKPVEITVFHSGVACAVLLVFAPWFFTLPSMEVLGDITIAALLTLGGSLVIAWAYARAETQALVPMEYSGFLWAALFGWLFFREEITLSTIAGTGLIVVGCWIAARQRPVVPQTEQSAL